MVVLYWIIVIIGVFDFDIFDLDLDTFSESDIVSGLFVFFNTAELPFMLFFRIWALANWSLSMMVYYLPIEKGGLINGMILIFIAIASLFLTKYVTMPLKGIFKMSDSEDSGEIPIVGQICTLRCSVVKGRLGQAIIRKEGASTVINVVAEADDISFAKGESAYVYSKDTKRNMYYIQKLGGE